MLIFECVVDIIITLRIHNSIMSRKKCFLPSIRRLFTPINVNRTSLYAYLKWKDCILRWPIPFIMLDSEYMVQITSGLIQSNWKQKQRAPAIQNICNLVYHVVKLTKHILVLRYSIGIEVTCIYYSLKPNMIIPMKYIV